MSRYSQFNVLTLKDAGNRLNPILEDLKPSGMKTVKYSEGLISIIKLLRDPLCTLVRIAAVLMKVLEGKPVKEAVISLGVVLASLTASMTQYCSFAIKTFESLER